MRRLLLVLVTLTFCAACGRRSEPMGVSLVSSAGDVAVRDVRFASPAIGGVMWYRAIVPQTQTGERLPVLYLLHGANSDPADVMQRFDFVKEAARQRVILILPSGESSYYTNAVHLRHADWEDAITRDLPADAVARFPILTEREHTGIAGISMGGYGAAKLALKHPELYGYIAVIAGALEFTRRPFSIKRLGQAWRQWAIFGLRRRSRLGEDVFALLQKSTLVPTTEWKIAAGKKDPLLGVNQRFAHDLKQHGAKVEMWQSPGVHDWQCWNAMLPKVIESAGKTLR